MSCTMCGRLRSKDIRETVIRVSKLGVGHTVTEAITGVSGREIQRIFFWTEK